MAHCPSCGGIIGRDCYNPVDCAEISRRNDNYDIHELEYQIEILKQALIDNNIPIPDLEMKRQRQHNNYWFIGYNGDCDLPF